MKKLLWFLVVSLVLLTGCSPEKTGLKEELVGKWVDGEGFVIEFKEDGTGFIPGVEGAIPDSSFTYTLTGESNLQITLAGKVYGITVEIEDDQLTWKDQLGEVVYTRVKE